MIGDGAEPDHGIYTLLREIVNNSVDEFTDGYGMTVVPVDYGNAYIWINADFHYCRTCNPVGYCYRFCLLRC